MSEEQEMKLMIGGPLAGQEVIAPHSAREWQMIHLREDGVPEVTGVYYQGHFATEATIRHYFLWQDCESAMLELMAHYKPE